MSSKERRFSKGQLRRIFAFTVLLIVCLVILLPVLWMFISSLKTPDEFTAYPIRIFPQIPQLINYYYIVLIQPFTSAMARTFLLSIGTAFITCITSSMAGYAFARINGTGRQALFSVVIALLIVPNVVLLIPQFILYAHYHIVNTFWPWILASLGATSPLYIFMYRQFFLGFPKELEEAAEMDGASPLRIFFYIILPNSKPALATIMIFAFNAVWGDYITPTLFLNNPYELLGPWLAGAPANIPVALAIAVVYMLPVVILFFLIQKNIQKGMIFTGMSG